MTNTAVEWTEPMHVARPLKMLVPMIKDDLAEGAKAAENAALPYYKAAGEKMIEAKSQLRHGDFGPWLTRNFKIGKSQAYKYMSYARHQNSGGMDFSNLNDFVRKTGPDPHHAKHVKKRPWHDAIDGIIERVKREAEWARKDELSHKQEREAERKLALRLIDIGYKVLAKELHPDKGGSRDAMARLNKVRNRLLTFWA